MMGGIGRLIGREDIVILKPNAQWWNQGMTNTDAMMGFIQAVVEIPGFKGEVILAENHHCFALKGGCDIRGWNTAEPNGRFSLSGLVAYFQERGHSNVTKYHWLDAGLHSDDGVFLKRTLRPLKRWAKEILLPRRARRVRGPEEGDGYVWSDVEYRYEDKKVKMSYPIFTSTFSGVTVDFRNGAWSRGRYTGQPVKFINFAGLNHHGDYAGVTASVKNYLGIVDMTCGYTGVTPEGYVNFHHIGVPGLGGAVGTFMNTIRKADLNITAAEQVGFASRTDRRLAARTRTVVAGTDPVALDYYAAKHILRPLGGPVVELNDPDNAQGPFRRYLELCAAQGGGTCDENNMEVDAFDFLG
jgi:hypothetical protein